MDQRGILVHESVGIRAIIQCSINLNIKYYSYFKPNLQTSVPGLRSSQADREVRNQRFEAVKK